jgi:UDP-4-amino-4,6-dideoxy-N-acetyl-beta-L-altrosamine N-acetyltransferase
MNRSSINAGQPDDCIEAHGVVLRRLRYEDIEKVRQWRNSPQVNQFMESRDHITPDAQERWFMSLDPARQLFYIAEANGDPVGVVNFKNLDVLELTAESGIYLADPGMRGRGLGRCVYMALLDHGFDRLGLQTVTARVLTDNHRSIRLHVSLGFRLVPGQGSIYNQLYLLQRSDYLSNTRSDP